MKNKFKYDIYGDERVLTNITKVKTISENNIEIDINEIKDTALYENLHGLETKFIARDSAAKVEILISYDENNFNGEPVNFNVYDSKCRTCQNDLTTIKNVNNSFLCLIYFKSGKNN
jgi:hypothetical protein